MSFLPKSISKRELHENALKFLRESLLNDVHLDHLQPVSKEKAEALVKPKPVHDKEQVPFAANEAKISKSIEPPERVTTTDSDSEFSSAFDNINIVSFKDYLMAHELDARDVFSKFRYQCRYGEQNEDFYLHPSRYQCIYEDYERVKLTQDLIEHLKQLKRENVLFYQIHISKIDEILNNCPEFKECDKEALQCFVEQYFEPISTILTDEEKSKLFQRFIRLSFSYLFKSCQKLEVRYRTLRKTDIQSPMAILYRRILEELFTSRSMINHFVRGTNAEEYGISPSVINLDLVDEFIERERTQILDFIQKLYEYLAANLEANGENEKCMPIFELRADPEFEPFYEELKKKCVRYSEPIKSVLPDIYNYYVVHHAHSRIEEYLRNEFNECSFAGIITIDTNLKSVPLDSFDQQLMPKFWRLQQSRLSGVLKEDMNIEREILKRGVGIYAFYWLHDKLKRLVHSIVKAYNIQWQWLQEQSDDVILENITHLESLEQECKDILLKNIKLYKSEVE